MNHSVSIKKRFAVSQSGLFELLSSPQHIQQWLSPHESIPVRVVAFEFREGGPFQLAYTMPEGYEAEMQGEFVQIEAPHRIVFTWQWQEPDEHAHIPTLVTWHLTAMGEDTELHLLHERIPHEGYGQRHQAGWQGALSRLEILLAQRQSE